MAYEQQKSTYTAAEVAVLENTIKEQQSQIQSQQTQIDLYQSRKVDTKNNYFVFVFSKVDISHIFA